MQNAPRAILRVAFRFAIGLSAGILLQSGFAQADVTTTAKRGAAGVKRGAHATAKAVAPAGRAVARGVNKGVTKVKRAGDSVGHAIRGQ